MSIFSIDKNKILAIFKAIKGKEGAMKILLVEDENIVRKTLVGILKDLEYQVTAAEDGRSALEIAQKGRFDVLLTDNQMPYMTGLELVHELRKQEICPEKVIMMSADEIDKLPKNVFFLKKTFKLIQLEELLKKD